MHWTVLAAWLALIGYGVRLLLSTRAAGVAATMTADGYQEALVLVRDGEMSSDIVVRNGLPVRLRFARDESAFRSERIVLPAFDKVIDVPSNGTVTVVLHPKDPGNYPFECTRQVFRGRLIVE